MNTYTVQVSSFAGLFILKNFLRKGINKMELKQINIQDIKSNPAQPEARVSKQAIKGLKSSIEQHGVLSPILISPDGVLVDGHRRVECLKELGITSVSAIIFNGELNNLNPMQAFRVANENTRKISALEYLDVYLSGGEVPHTTMKQIVFIVEKLGRRMLKKLKSEKVSPFYVGRLHPTFKKCHFTDIDFKQFFEWALKHRALRVLVIFEKWQTPSRLNKLRDCIKQDTPFKLN